MRGVVQWRAALRAAAPQARPRAGIASHASRGDVGPRAAAASKDEEPVEFPPGTYLRTFLPWLSMVELVPPREVRERITAFSSHSGLLYALMASMSTAGLLWDPAAAAAAATAAPETAAASLDDVTSAIAVLSDRIGVDAHGLMVDLTAPLFCMSTFFNLQGLMTSMLTLGRVQVVPDSRVVPFVKENRFTLHSAGWLLIPSVATLACAVVCATESSHGGGTTHVGLAGLLALGTLTCYQTMSLGYATEKQCIIAQRSLK